VLAVSLPSLLDEMTPEDEGDFDRFQKLLDRLGKAMIMSAETETSEIIRRRLFEWGGTSLRQCGTERILAKAGLVTPRRLTHVGHDAYASPR
jgi:hypothetical protein